MTEAVRLMLVELEQENERLEQENVCPDPIRLTQYEIARCSGDITLRRIGKIAEKLDIRITELVGDDAIMPRTQ